MSVVLRLKYIDGVSENDSHSMYFLECVSELF